MQFTHGQARYLAEVGFKTCMLLPRFSSEVPSEFHGHGSLP